MRFLKTCISILLIVTLAIPSLSPLSSVAATHGTNQSWLYVGSELNYSQKLVIKEPSYDNVSKSTDYFEIITVSPKLFNFSERQKYYGHLGPPQNKSLPINSSVVISQSQKTGSYPGSSFFVVNGTILKMISKNSSLYFNYKNAKAPLNISSTNYSFNSQEIPSYRLSAREPLYRYASTDQSQSYVIVNITLFVDSSNGIVLYENENQSYAEGVYYDTIHSIEGSNFLMINSGQTSQYNWASTIVGVSILAVVFVLGFILRSRRR